jgi:hypothetical protein
MKLSWGWRIAIVYTFFAVSTVGFVAFAMTENVELVRTDYYEQSLKHDQTFAAEQRGLAVASQLDVKIAEGRLQIGLPASHTQIDSGSISLYRPDNSILDHTYSVHETSVSIPISGVVSGNYELGIEWAFNGERYRVVRPIEIGGGK